MAKVDLPKFVMGGRRTDYDIASQSTTRHDWAEALREDAKTNGTLHDFGGIDCFVYPRGMFGEIPQFALGRWYWDNGSCIARVVSVARSSTQARV